eukprot:765852-Hanusia_phi.AAC.13
MGRGDMSITYRPRPSRSWHGTVLQRLSRKTHGCWVLRRKTCRVIVVHSFLCVSTSLPTEF